MERDATDMVDHPAHYTRGGIECIDALRAALGTRGFVDHCRACAIKYAWRSPHKGREDEDLRKAAWYLDRAAGELEAVALGPAAGGDDAGRRDARGGTMLL